VIQLLDVQELINNYTEWLRREITFSKVGEYYEITTPFLNSANDYLQIYVKQEENEIFFSDDGDTIHDLELNGLNFTSARKKLLKQLLASYGVQINGKELTTRGPISMFPQKKHMFVQAMLSVDDMFMVSKGKISSFFLDDIQKFFEENEIYCSDNVQFTGISGYTHVYDFLIQRSKNHPERLCRAINSGTKSNMENVLFAWQDTKPVRKQDSKLIVLLNDGNPIARGVEEGFQNYGAHVLRWSHRNEQKNLSILSAS